MKCARILLLYLLIFFRPIQQKNVILGVKLNFILFSPKINEFHQKKFRPPTTISPTLEWNLLFFPEKMSDSEDEIPRYSPQLVRETYTTGRVFKNPRVEYFKEIIRKNQGQNQLPLKDLEFYKSEILSKIPLAQITRKKVRDFCKASRWKVNGNEHSIFNYIIDPDGNDFLPYEDLEIYLIDDFKRFSLAYNELNLPRKRFLNCHHVLFWLLKKNGFHPNEEDFKLLTLPQKRAEQEKIIQTIFKKYNWKENGVPK